MGGLQGSPDGKQIERPYNHPFLRLTRKLEDGFVVTVEPGFYFIDQLLDEAKAKPIGKMIDWKRVAELKHFGGVRIEDNVVARPGGQENLTRPAFCVTCPWGAALVVSANALGDERREVTQTSPAPRGRDRRALGVRREDRREDRLSPRRAEMPIAQRRGRTGSSTSNAVAPPASP